MGILLSIPAALVSTALYRLLLLKAVSRYPTLAVVFKPASAVVLALFALEVVLLATMGAVHSRALIGPSFAFVHLAVFILGTPALANVLVLRAPAGVLAKGYLVVPLCTLFAVVLVVLQYGVTDLLYGKFGQGPYPYP